MNVIPHNEHEFWLNFDYIEGVDVYSEECNGTHDQAQERLI